MRTPFARIVAIKLGKRQLRKTASVPRIEGEIRRVDVRLKVVRKLARRIH
jgi:hypothetical protein